MSPRTLVLLCTLALTALVGFAFAPASYDDGYITYRYADNFARGQGFVFNPGESLLGTSAPGYGLFLGALTRFLQPLGAGVDQVGSAVFLLGLALLPLFLARLIRQSDGKQPELTAAIFALLAIPARWNVELMGCEQLPILVLVVVGFTLAFDRREFAAGLSVGLAGAFRSDAGLAIAALAIAVWIDRRRVPWRFALAAAFPIALCWTWLFATFGSILPVTLAGKRSEMEFVVASYNSSTIDWLTRTVGPIGAAAVLFLAICGGAGAARLRGRARPFPALCRRLDSGSRAFLSCHWSAVRSLVSPRRIQLPARARGLRSVQALSRRTRRREPLAAATNRRFSARDPLRWGCSLWRGRFLH